MIEKIHHAFYAVAIVASVAIVTFFWPQHPSPLPPVLPGTSPQVSDTLVKEFQAGLSAGIQLAASKGAVPVQARPAVAVVDHFIGNGFSQAGKAAWLSAVGRQNTAPAIHLSGTQPIPAPTPSNAPGITDAYAQWHFDSTYAAVTKAMSQQHLNVHVTQDPVPPSRVQTAYLSDGSAGAVYALRRRGLFDLDAGLTIQGAETEATAGFGARFKNTSAGVYVGPTYNFTTHKAGVAGGLLISF